MQEDYKIINRLKSLLMNEKALYDPYYQKRGYPAPIEEVREILFSTSSDRLAATNDLLRYVRYDKYFPMATTLDTDNYELTSYNFDTIKIFRAWEGYKNKVSFMDLTGNNYQDLKDDLNSNKFSVQTLRSLVTLFLLTVYYVYLNGS